MRRFWPTFGLCLVGSLTLMGASCQNSPSESRKVPSQSIVLNPNDLKKAPYDKGEIVLLGTPVPVSVEFILTANGFRLVSMVEGRPYEEENYLADATSLRFTGTDVEAFSPAIPLVAQPFEVPGDWTWAGTMKFAGKTFKASADLKSSKETLNLPGGPYESVRVDVDLSMQDPGGSIGKRKLSFWLTDEDGIIKREFAQSSTRQPSGSSNSES